MSSLDRGVLAMVAGSVLGVAFIDRIQQQHLQIAFVMVALLIAGSATMGGRPLTSLDTVTASAWTGWAFFGMGMIVFGANVFSLSSGTDNPELALYAVATLSMLGFGIAYLVGHRRIYWFGFLVAYAGLIALVVVDIIPVGVFTDVQLFQHDAVTALMRGDNPFTMQFRDIYPPAQSALFYGNGVSVNGILQFGYPYFPLSLLVVAPFEILGDYRFAHALAVIGAALLMSRMTVDHRSTIAAMVFLLVSPSIVVVQNGWTDPLALLALVGVVFVAIHRPKGRSIVTGLLFAAKQTSVFLVVPSMLVLEKPWSVRVIARHFAVSGGVFLVLTLPFVLWDPRAFWTSVVRLQFVQPFRSDSVALPALIPDWWLSLHPLVSLGAPFLAVVIGSIAVARRTPTGAQGFALGSAFVLLVALVTSKQAFVNYYLVVIGSLFAAAAATYDTATGEESNLDMGSPSSTDLPASGVEVVEQPAPRQGTQDAMVSNTRVGALGSQPGQVAGWFRRWD